MKTKDWYAWINFMPPPPDDFHVIGDVEVGNPGVEVQLSVKNPQGINPTILLLDLNLVQKPGVWPQVLTWAHARYDRVISPGQTHYRQVEIFYNNEVIAKMEVNEVH